jgi:vaccinia related kinase
MPKFITLGFHEVGGIENRFIVMERFGTDLQKLFVESGKQFPRKTVGQLAIRVVSLWDFILRCISCKTLKDINMFFDVLSCTLYM